MEQIVNNISQGLTQPEVFLGQHAFQKSGNQSVPLMPNAKPVETIGMKEAARNAVLIGAVMLALNFAIQKWKS